MLSAGRRLSSRRCPCNGGARRDLRRCRAGCRRRRRRGRTRRCFCCAMRARSSPSSRQTPRRCCCGCYGRRTPCCRSSSCTSRLGVSRGPTPATALLLTGYADTERARARRPAGPAALALRVRASSAASRPCAHHGRSHAGARPLRRARRGARAAGRCRALQAALGGVACHLSYAQALGLFGKPSPFGKVLRGPPRHAVPAKALVQATVFLLQRRALVALHTYVHCVAEPLPPSSLWRLPRVRAGSSFSKCARCSPASTTSRRSRGRKASRPTRCVISSRRTTSVSC